MGKQQVVHKVPEEIPKPIGAWHEEMDCEFK
jgi:hypothetical protein